MRLALAIITLALTGCSSTPQSTRPARDYTVGMAQCSKFKWGTPEMAQCLDRAAETQPGAGPTDGGGSG